MAPFDFQLPKSEKRITINTPLTKKDAVPVQKIDDLIFSAYDEAGMLMIEPESRGKVAELSGTNREDQPVDQGRGPNTIVIFHDETPVTLFRRKNKGHQKSRREASFGEKKKVSHTR